MEEKDYIELENFCKKLSTGFTEDEAVVIYKLHAKYFHHEYEEPCSCGGQNKFAVLNRWVNDLKTINN